VDDAILTAMAKTFQQAHNKLSDMMTREGGAIEWTKTHNLHFEYGKIVLIDLVHHSNSEPRPTLTLPNIMIMPTKSTKYLGVILDQGLNWKEQTAYIVGKGSTWSTQIRRVVRPSWGLTPRAARRIYIGVALPCILYRIDIWCYIRKTTHTFFGLFWSFERPKRPKSTKRQKTSGLFNAQSVY
jgi:hypothetical protein